MDAVVVKQLPNVHRRPAVVAAIGQPGRRIGRLVIQRKNALGRYVCRCDCGFSETLRPRHLREGKIFECAACRKWRAKTPTRRWLGDRAYRSISIRGKDAKSRCQNTSNKSYRRYGGRGIEFRFQGLEHYCQCVGVLVKSYGLNKEVDRIDNDGHYEPSNIRLSTPKENSRNRSKTIMIGKKPLAEIAESMGLRTASDGRMYANLRHRILYAISIGKEPDESFVIKSILDIISKGDSKPRSARKPSTPMSIEGRLLKEVLEGGGFGGIYVMRDRAKHWIYRRRKSGKPETIEALLGYLNGFAERNGIQPKPTPPSP